MSGQAGSQHVLAEFTRDDIDEMVAARPALAITGMPKPMQLDPELGTEAFAPPTTDAGGTE